MEESSVRNQFIIDFSEAINPLHGYSIEDLEACIFLTSHSIKIERSVCPAIKEARALSKGGKQA